MNSSKLADFKRNYIKFLIKNACDMINCNISDKMIDKISWCSFCALSGYEFKAVQDTYYEKVKFLNDVDCDIVFISSKDYLEMKSLDIIYEDGEFLRLTSEFINVINTLQEKVCK